MLYYIAAHDAGRSRMLAGPYTTEAEAEQKKDSVVKRVNEEYPFSWFYTFSLGKSEKTFKTLYGAI